MRPDTPPPSAPPSASPSTSAPPMAPAANPRAALFKDRNFRWLTGGAFLSMLGDQFTLLALP